MSHALGEDNWDDWEDDTRRGVRNQFRWSLQALACDADVQLTLFPDFVCKPKSSPSIMATGPRSRDRPSPDSSPMSNSRPSGRSTPALTR